GGYTRVLSRIPLANARGSDVLIRSRTSANDPTTAQCVSASPFIGPESPIAGRYPPCLFLVPLVLPFLPNGHSENCSLKLPRIRQKCGRVRGVEQHWHQRRRQRKGAGRTLETPGSTC